MVVNWSPSRVKELCEELYESRGQTGKGSNSMTQETHRDSQKLLSPQQFADRLVISRWTTYSWISEGKIKSVKIGRLVRIPESEVERIVQEGLQEVLD
jgi:excisionase family DNA binding protein